MIRARDRDADSPGAEAAGEAMLARCVAELAGRVERGEPLDLDAYAAGHPDLAEELRRLLPVIVMMADLGMPTPDLGPDRYEHADLPPPSEPAGDLQTLGDFHLLRVVGRGGMGVVYEAVQVSLRRRVALKVLPFAAVLDERRLLRFQVEAQAAAGLHHNHIVPVFVTGMECGVPFYAMQFIDGRDLAQVITGGGLGQAGFADREHVRAAARLGRQAAEALDFAHRNDVLHRDIKPSNLMVDADGEVWITDFGLARVRGDAGLTGSGDFLGTPRYMSPEQVLGRRAPLDGRADVYALGATLFELLTGQPAFTGGDRLDLLRRIVHEPPRPIRRLNPAVSADLETVVLKAMAKDPSDRYATAGELAEDLDRYLEDRPVKARRSGPWGRVVRWSRRHQGLMVSSTVLALVLAAGLAAAVGRSNAWLRAHNERLRQEIGRADGHAAEADRQRQLAEARKTLADRHLHAAQLRLARQACDLGQFERAQEVLMDDSNGPGPAHRDFAWWYLWQFSRSEVCLFGRHDAPVRRVERSPDGGTLASSDEAGGIVLWDTASGRARARFSGHAGAIDWLAFSPDGRVLASCGDVTPTPSGGKSLRLWDVSRGHPLARPEVVVRGQVRQLAFLDRGRLLSVVTSDAAGVRTVRTWDLDLDLRTDASASTSALRLRYEAAGFGFVIPSPDGRFLAVREPDGRLTLRDASSGAVSRTVSDGEPGAVALAVSPDGRLLAAAAPPDRVLVWELAGRDEPRTYRDDAGCPDRLIFSPDGTTLVAVVGGRQVNALNLTTGRKRVIEALDPARVGTFDLAFSPDGARLALDGDGHPGGPLTATVWRLASGEREKTFPGRRSLQHLSFSPDGTNLFLGGAHDLSVWRLSPAERLDTFANHHDEVWAVAFAPDGLTVASGGNDDALRLWDPETGRESSVLRGHTATVAAAAFRPDGRVIATGSLDLSGNLKLWDAATGRLVAALAGHTEGVRSVAFSPDGTTVASAGSDRTVRLWDGATGEARSILSGHDEVVRQVAFSPDGRTLASAGNDRTVRLWEVERGRPAGVFRHRYKVTSVAFSPDGRTLASADENGFVNLWEPVTRSPRLVINGDDDEIRALAFSPDGRTLASGGVSRAVRLWDPVTGQELLTLDGCRGQVNSLAFSPDGGTLLAADHSGVVRIFRGVPDATTVRKTE